VSFLIFMALVLVVLYVLMIRPQRQRQRDHQSMIDEAGVGEDVLTSGGIYGTVVRVEGDDLVVEIADGVQVHMTRRGIAAVLPPEDEVDEEVEEELEADDGEGEVVEGEAVHEPETPVR
jgi:preprotein translocase subunit YajC